MRTKKPTKRKAWLITWEDDFRKGLDRPRVVAILKPQLGGSRIRDLLPVLFLSESRLTFSERMGRSFSVLDPNWLYSDLNGRIFCGGSPFLFARIVKDLYAEKHEDVLGHETLHWTELPRYERDGDTTRFIEAYPEQAKSEEVYFLDLWSAESRSMKESS